MCRRASLIWFVSLLVWSGVSALPGFAQPASISGTVVDVAGLAVAGAEVTARTPDGRTTTVTTGGDGSFTITGPVASLRVVSPGFAAADLEPTGPRLFETVKLQENLRLDFIGSETFQSGVIALHYNKHTLGETT